MASLALLVCIIFLSLIFSGLFTLLLVFLNFKILALFFGILAIIIGFYWILVAPFPVSLLGFWNIFCGIVALLKH
jgi:hypothetical protein